MSNKEYFNRRAADEIAAAMNASDPKVARIHMDLAREYEQRASADTGQEVQVSGQSMRLTQ